MFGILLLALIYIGYSGITNGFRRASRIEYVSNEISHIKNFMQNYNTVYNDRLDNAVLILADIVDDMYSGNRTVLIMLICGAIFVIISAIVIVRSVVIPVSNLVNASKEIAKGNINVNLPKIAADELGELTKQFSGVAMVLKGLTDEMTDMANRHFAGDTEARINENHYEGAFKNVVLKLNELTGSYDQHTLDLCHILNEFGAGDFNVPYAALPGKKAYANNVIESLRKNLKDIGKEIITLSDAAANGDLTMKIDTLKFKGEWAKLAEGLNNLAGVIMEPINEASDVLYKMSNGDFSAVVQGNYKGAFGLIKNSLNSTQEAIASYIYEINSVLYEVANQNLNVQIDRPYIGDFHSIKDSINTIISTLNDILSNIYSSADNIAIGAKQISESSYKLSQGATEQASEVQKLTGSMEIIAKQTSQNEIIASKTNELSSSARRNAEIGNNAMSGMLEAMREINESSDNISRIIKAIKDIAFQTNLLALNAAVEAARAGDHGKGFSVVAEEVGMLAGKSQVAAKDTATLIEGSVQKAFIGMQISNETAEALKIIVRQIIEISNYVHDISASSKEQNEKISQMSKSIAEISQITGENVAISEESAASAEELSSQAEMFRNVVAQFKLK